MSDHPDLLHLPGVVNHRLGGHRVAGASVGRAFERNQTDAFYSNTPGGIMMAHGRPADAAFCCRNALAINPEVAEFHMCPGEAKAHG